MSTQNSRGAQISHAPAAFYDVLVGDFAANGIQQLLPLVAANSTAAYFFLAGRDFKPYRRTVYTRPAGLADGAGIVIGAVGCIAPVWSAGATVVSYNGIDAPGTVLTITAAANAVSTHTTYTGTFPATNTLAGATVTIAGFVTNPGNNGTFVVFSNTASSLVVINSGGVAETQAATATTVGPAASSYVVVNSQVFAVTISGVTGSTAPVWNFTVGGTTVDNTATWTCLGYRSIVSVSFANVSATAASPTAQEYSLFQE